MLAISCSEEAEPILENPYSWTESHLSPDNQFSFAQLDVGDDGVLYAFGISPLTGEAGIFKYPGPTWFTNNTWTNIGEPDVSTASNLLSFEIHKGSIYFHVFDKLYQVEAGQTKEILSGDIITSIEATPDKLVIVGEGLNVSNDHFTIVSYDGTTIEPLSKEMSLSRSIQANNKVYIPGYPSHVYDGQTLNDVDFYGYFLAVDEDESLYFGDSYNERFTLSKQFIGGEKEVLGSYIEEMGSIFQSLELFDGTVFVIGVDYQNELTKVYFLNGDQWIQIPTDHVSYDVIVFDNKLISFAMDGKIYELAKK
jgi:hypothetical protein